MQQKTLAATLLVTIFLAACAGSNNAFQPTSYPTSLATTEASVMQTTSTFEPVSIKLGIQPFASNLPLYIAQEEGYFAEQGLDVEFVPIISQVDLLPTIILGEIDVTGSALSLAQLKAIQETPGLRFVADKGYLDPNGCNYNAWVVSNRSVESSGVPENLEDLKNLTFGFSRAVPLFEYYLDLLLEPAGLTTNDMQISEVPTDLVGEALQNNAIDISVLVEPSLTRVVDAGGGQIWIGVQEYAPEFQYGLLWYGSYLTQDNRDAGNRFMLAYLKAVEQYNQGKTDRNVELMAEFSRLSVEEARSMCWASYRADGSILAESIVDFQEWAVDNGYLDTIVSVETFWDGGFVQYALTMLGN